MKMRHYMTTYSGRRYRMSKIVCDFLCNIKFPLFIGSDHKNERVKLRRGLHGDKTNNI